VNLEISELVLFDMASLTEENLDIEVDENKNLFINISQILKSEVVPDVPDMCIVLPEDQQSDPADVPEIQTETLEYTPADVYVSDILA